MVKDAIQEGKSSMSLFSRRFRSAPRAWRRSAPAPTLLVENIANAETTRTPEGGPYRRKDVVFSSRAVSLAFRLRVRGPTRRRLTGVEGPT